MEALYRVFISLKLTVGLLCALLVLVFLGTLDQVHYGIYEVQQRYFESFIAFWHYPFEWLGGRYLRWLIIPLPGGLVIGMLLSVNLICAHFHYFKSSWRKLGVMLTHGGLILLIVSGFITSLFQEESRMWIAEGAQSNYSESFRENELVIVDITDSTTERVYSFPQKLIEKGAVLMQEGMPMRVQVDAFYPNAEIGMRSQNPNGLPNLATQGAGKRMDMVVNPLAITYRDNEVNTATAYVTLSAGEEVLGTWLVSNLMDERFPAQTFSYKDRTYAVALRFKRTYFPFTLQLEKFSFDKYPGTQIPKNFSSAIRVINPSKGENRPVLIYMNHPLRYEGYTFYQASFSPNQTDTMFQVVRNPGFALPYLALFIIGVGLLYQSLFHLIKFLRQNQLHAKH